VRSVSRILWSVWQWIIAATHAPHRILIQEALAFLTRVSPYAGGALSALSKIAVLPLAEAGFLKYRIVQVAAAPGSGMSRLNDASGNLESTRFAGNHAEGLPTPRARWSNATICVPQFGGRSEVSWDDRTRRRSTVLRNFPATTIPNTGPIEEAKHAGKPFLLHSRSCRDAGSGGTLAAKAGRRARCPAPS